VWKSWLAATPVADHQQGFDPIGRETPRIRSLQGLSVFRGYREQISLPGAADN
jgi:hypothetical protein